MNRHVHLDLTGVLRGVSNRLVKLLYSYIYTYVQTFWSLIYLEPEINLPHFDWREIFARYFGHVLPVILYLAQACADQRAHDPKCLWCCMI